MNQINTNEMVRMKKALVGHKGNLKENNLQNARSLR